jgi:LemA protein
MSQTIYVWLILACGLFWLVGVYNRLMRLRSRALDVSAALDKQVMVCVRLVATQAEATDQSDEAPTQAPFAPFDECWLQLLQANRFAEAVWGASRKNRLSDEAQQRRAESWGHLQDAWNAWLAQPPDLAGARVPDTLAIEWEANAAKVLVIQEALNRILEGYNDAIQQYPARCVSGILGFGVIAPL